MNNKSQTPLKRHRERRRERQFQERTTIIGYALEAFKSMVPVGHEDHFTYKQTADLIVAHHKNMSPLYWNDVYVAFKHYAHLLDDNVEVVPYGYTSAIRYRREK